MGDFFGFVCCIVGIVWLTITVTEYSVDPKDTHEMLTEVCKKNGGIVSSKISVSSWKFECTDGAVFKVVR